MLPLLQSTPVPFSAFALCFIPLATVVFGLFAFFALTDRHANRPYLRYNELRAVTTPPAQQAARGPVVGETPAGPLGGTSSQTKQIYTGGGEIGSVVEVPNTGAPAASTTVVATSKPVEGDMAKLPLDVPLDGGTGETR